MILRFKQLLLGLDYNFNSLILILVMPAMSAVSERSFSTLRKDITAYNQWTSPT